MPLRLGHSAQAWLKAGGQGHSFASPGSFEERGSGGGTEMRNSSVWPGDTRRMAGSGGGRETLGTAMHCQWR